MTTNTIRPTEIDGNGDTDTSIVFPGSNYLRFYSGGTEMMELKLGDGVNLLQNTIFTPDNTYDLGQFSFVNRRPANAYIGTSLYYGSSVRNGDVSSSVQILGTRQTGWGAPTGTATRTTFDTSSATTQDVAERLKALIDDLTTHGLIGP